MLNHKYSYLVGTKLNSLLIERLEKNDKGQLRLVCTCDCGSIKNFGLYHVLNSRSKTCGCSKISKFQKHGKSNLLAYSTWEKMMDRCYNKNSRNYRFYGARGIAICDRWKNPANFIQDMGDRPTKKHSIDRIDNSKGYSPDNCRWATFAEQVKNRSNRSYFEFGSCRMLLVEWVNFLGVSYGQLDSAKRRKTISKQIRAIITSENFVACLDLDKKYAKNKPQLKETL